MKQFLLLVLSLGFIVGCEMLSNETRGPENQQINSLTIRIGSPGRSLLPDLDLETAKYVITGTCKGKEASFETSTNESIKTIEGLVFGEWEITVTALNEDEERIGIGYGNVQINSSGHSEVEVTIQSITGTGSFTLELNWNESIVQNPNVIVELDLSGEDPYYVSQEDINYSNSGASLEIESVSAGLHALKIQLFDGDILVAGAAESVLIVMDNQTSGSISFDALNPAFGTLSLTMEEEIHRPVPFEIVSYILQKKIEEELILGTSIENYTDSMTVTWFVNGEQVSQGETYTMDDNWKLGEYRIDAIYENYNGQFGSDYINIKVVSSSTIQNDFSNNSGTILSPEDFSLIREIEEDLGNSNGTNLVAKKNIALGMEVTGNSQYSEDYRLSYVNDGLLETVWASTTDDIPHWLFIDLGEPMEISGVQIQWFEDYFAKKISIGVSNNLNEPWEIVAGLVNNNSNQDYYCSFSEPIEYQYIGFLLEGKNKEVYAIEEFLVYNNAIEFPDKNFEQLIRSVLDMPMEDIYISDLENVDTLAYDGKDLEDSEKIQNLSGIEYCQKLRTLHLNNHLISDLTPLASLNIGDIYLQNNKIEDITPLENHSFLFRLGLEGNSVSDIGILSGLTKINLLGLNDNPIEDFSPIADLTELYFLALRNTGINNIDVLSDLTKVEYLYLGDNTIQDLQPIANYSLLTWLSIDGNNMSIKRWAPNSVTQRNWEIVQNLLEKVLYFYWEDGNDTTNEIISFSDPVLDAVIRNEIAKPAGEIYDYEVLGLTTLEYIGYNKEEISDLTGLEHCIYLQEINLRYNNISDLSPLQNLNNLNYISLGYNQITDVSPLSELEDLTFLNIEHNEVDNIEPISGLEELLTLSLFSNPVVDISYLENFPKLQKLTLGESSITDISVLELLPNLTEISFYALSIDDTDLEVLNTLDNLVALGITGMGAKIENIEALRGISTLSRLYLSGNHIKDLSPIEYLDLRDLRIQYNDMDLTPGSTNLEIVNRHLSNGCFIEWEYGNIIE